MRFTLIILMFLLSACGTTPTKVDVTYRHVYPDLPPIDEPQINLKPYKYDLPRDSKGKPIKSNIFAGFDLKNWTILQENMLTLESVIVQYRTRIQEINRQREEWRNKNVLSE